ncbi:Six-hairpin glycosidase-like protein [Cladorrhinum sp. PSN332]|nr:Six-hairpin glycosidase-like protein [Cladorrhinum sp. PSN332]
MPPTFFFTLLAYVLSGLASARGISYEHLPDRSVFPGPWDKYIKAPADKERVEPVGIFRTVGNVTVTADSRDYWNKEGRGANGKAAAVSVGGGGEATWDFGENIAGRVCFAVVGSSEKGVNVSLGYSESSWFAGREPDSTGDRVERDLPLVLGVTGKGSEEEKVVCVGREFVRGGFRYLTLVVLEDEEEGEGEGEGTGLSWWETAKQSVLGGVKGGKKDKKKEKKKEGPWLSVGKVWVNCTAFPSQKNGRAYSGYFYSSSDLLNRIWYAGAWTLQLSTIDPKEGGALIDYNRAVDGNSSPTGSWYSNFTISNGSAVTTDGAKRDRMVWPGDMYIAIPGIAISTYDLVAVRNALDVLYDFQYGDGSLPYAGPPMGYHGEFSDTYHMHTLLGTYFYVLYSGDLDWLRGPRWERYLKALGVSTGKVDEYDLLHVSSTADWLRPGMTGHNVEATAILHEVLGKSAILAEWLGKGVKEESMVTSWKQMQSRLSNGLSRLYCSAAGLYSDNIGKRSCEGRESCLPQDGNSWALISGIDLTPSGLPWEDPKSANRSDVPLPEGPPTAQNISANLRSRWTKYGAPAVEFPNVISPFSSGFELLAHHSAGRVDRAVELILLEWGYLLDGPGFTNSTLAEGFRVDGDVQYPAYWSSARNSHAHGWSSGPTQLLTRGVLGIEILGLAGSRWRVNAELTDWLGWARGGFTTTKGKFEIRVWRVRIGKGSSAVTVEVKAPKGTKGHVGIGAGTQGGIEVDGGETRLFYKMDGDGEQLRSLDLGQKKVRGMGEDAEDWYKNIVVELEDGRELVFDHEWKEPVMQQREPGVVNWDVMEKYFKTEPPKGWSVDSLRKKVNT